MRLSRRRLARLGRGAAVVVGGVCLLAAASAGAAEQVGLQAGFHPYRLGGRTTIEFGFQIAGPGGAQPSALETVDVSLPSGLSLATSTLGIARCSAGALLEDGPEGCSPDALLGHGSALVEVDYGPLIVDERAAITTVLGPPQGKDQGILFYAEGDTPLATQLVFGAKLLAPPGSSGGSIDATVPLIPTLPEGPDAALGGFSSTIGPDGLTYERSEDGRRTRYHPLGIAMPRRCPRGGFHFEATLVFQDGSVVNVSHRVPCPSGGPAG